MNTEAAIRAARASVNEAIRRRDPAAIGALLLPSYHVITARSLQRVSREDSVRGWTEMFAKDPEATYEREPEVIHVNDEWGMAQEHGRWSGTLNAIDGLLAIEGVYAAKWHLTNDGWRLQAEIFTPMRVTRP